MIPPPNWRRLLGAISPASLLALTSLAAAASAQLSFQLPVETNVGPAPRRLVVFDATSATFVSGGDDGLAVLQRRDGHVEVIARIPTDGAVRALAVAGAPGQRHVAWATRNSTDVTVAPLGPRGAIGVDQVVELPGRTSALTQVPLDDGEPVFIAAHSRGIVLLRRDAEQRFRASPLSPVELATDLEICDLNGDGKADLIAVDDARGLLVTFLGDGTGGFTARDEIATNLSPTRVVAYDLDQDQSLELFAIGQLGLSIHERNRRGVFGTARVLIEAPHLADLAIADFDRDGRADLAYTNRSRGTITFLFGREHGKLGDETVYLVGHGPGPLVVMDDGTDTPPDVLVANELSNDVTYLHNLGQRHFAGTPAVAAAISPLSALALADFNLDSHLDMALVSAPSGRLQVYLGSADGSFEPLSSRPVVQQPLDLVAADMDGDAKPDLAVVDFSTDRVAFLEGNGQGRFAVPIFAPVGHGPAAIVHGDFGGPAGNDLAVANRLSDTVSILEGDSRGNFTTGETFKVVPRPSFLMVADTNDDGKSDLIVGSPLSESIAILTYDDKHGLSEPVLKVLGETAVPTPAVDLDGDGNVDLITIDAGAGEISVLAGKKGGGFGPPQSFRVGRDPARIASGDFDGDGALDLAVMHGDTAVVAILRNTGKRSAPGATPSAAAKAVTPRAGSR